MIPSRREGLTLVELMVAAVVLAIGITVLLWAFLGQALMSEHARNVAWAMNDTSRVMEQIRLQNTGATCLAPSVVPPGGLASWDAWLADTSANGGGGKSVQPSPNTNELLVVTSSGADPLSVTVAVCWRHRERVVGECTWTGASLSPDPAAGGDPVITESVAMVSTLLTCR